MDKMKMKTLFYILLFIFNPPLFLLVFIGEKIINKFKENNYQYLQKNNQNTYKATENTKDQVIKTEVKKSTVQKTTTSKTLKEEIPQNMTLYQEGLFFAGEIEKANSLIPDKVITQDLNFIKDTVMDIINISLQDKTKEKYVKKFISQYLPMTLKLLNIYIKIDNRKVQTPEMRKTKEDIAKFISEAKVAYHNLNNEIFNDTKLDVSSEISALKSILSSDGLLIENELKIPRDGV